MGAIEQTLAKQAVQSRRPLDPRIQNAPELNIGLELYFQAFFDLNSERQTGMGVGPIPGTAIRAYAKHYEFDEDQSDSLEYYISQMDNAHIKRLNEKQAAKNG